MMDLNLNLQVGDSRGNYLERSRLSQSPLLTLRPPKNRSASPITETPKSRSRTPSRSPVAPQSPGRRSPSPARRGRSESPRRRLSKSPAARKKSVSRSRSRSRSRSSRSRSISRSRSPRRHSTRRRSSRSPSYRRYGRSPSPRYSSRYRSRRSRTPPSRRKWSPRANRSNGVGEPGNNLFVAGFNFITTDHDLRRKFSNFGRVLDARIVRDKKSGDSRGFGFITLESDEQADAAIEALDQTKWNGRVVLVEKAKTATRF